MFFEMQLGNYSAHGLGPDRYLPVIFFGDCQTFSPEDLNEDFFPLLY
jgi:hypothetical protein